MKLKRLPEARVGYVQAKAWTTDKVISTECDLAIQFIDRNPNAQTASLTPIRNGQTSTTSTTPSAASIDAMIARAKQQLSDVMRAEQRTPQKDVTFLLERYKEALDLKRDMEQRLAVYRSRIHNPADIASQEQSFQTSINAYDREAKQLVQIYPDLREFLQNLDAWETQEKSAVTQTGAANTEPKLQALGSDYYTKNYSANPRPTPVEPNELEATQERMILDPHSTPGKTISRIVKVPAATTPANAALKVRGNLIPDAVPRSSTAGATSDGTASKNLQVRGDLIPENKQ